MKKEWLFLAFAMWSHSATAQDFSGKFYASVGGGVHRLSDADISREFIEHRYSNGWSGIGNLGYAFSNGIRTEFEVGYRKNALDSVNSYGNPLAGTADQVLSGYGHVTAWTFMGNVLYEYDNKSRFSPYIGGGLGVAALHYNNALGYEPTSWVVPVHGNESAPAVQTIVGINYSITDHMRVFMDYRYLATKDPKTWFGENPETDVEYDASTILIGLRVPLGD